jgi:hypothetical protein
MTQIPTGGVNPNKDISVQSAKLEKVRDKTADKVELNSKGTSEVSRPSRVAKAKEAVSTGLKAVKTFLGKKSTNEALDNTNIAKTTVGALNSGQSVHPAKPKSEGLGPQFSGPMKETPEMINEAAKHKQTATDFDFLDSLTSQPKPTPQEQLSRPVARPLPNTPGQRSNSDAVSEKKFNVRPGPKLTPKVIEKKEYDISARVFKNELEAKKQAEMNDQDFPSDLPPELPDDLLPENLPPSDLPPEWSDDLLPENLPPDDLPPEWSDDLLPKEGEVGVTGDKAVDQSAKNELQCGYIFKEIVSTEATYLSGLREFNTILDDAVKQNPKNSKLMALSQDHKAHLEKAEEFSRELNRVKNETGLDAPKKVIQLYDEKLMQGYAKTISSLACNFGANSKVVNALKKDLKSIYPELDPAELNKKTTILSDRGTILPIQRMPRHTLLILEIKKNAPQDEKELNAIFEKAQNLTAQINEDKRKSEIEDKRKSSFFRK